MIDKKIIATLQEVSMQEKDWLLAQDLKEQKRNGMGDHHQWSARIPFDLYNAIEMGLLMCDQAPTEENVLKIVEKHFPQYIVGANDTGSKGLIRVN